MSQGLLGRRRARREHRASTSSAARQFDESVFWSRVRVEELVERRQHELNAESGCAPKPIEYVLLQARLCRRIATRRRDARRLEIAHAHWKGCAVPRVRLAASFIDQKDGACRAPTGLFCALLSS